MSLQIHRADIVPAR